MVSLSYLTFDPSQYSALVASIPAGAKNPLDVRVLAEELRRLCKRYDLNMALIWSQIMHETAGFTSDVWSQRKNPAGIKNAGSDAFMRYDNGVDAARAMVSHVAGYVVDSPVPMDLSLDPRYSLARRIAFATPKDVRPLLTTVAKSWAEDPHYADLVAGWYDRLFASANVPAAQKSKPVLVTAGHHNASGGNPEEYSLTDDLARAYVKAFTAAGVRIEWWQAIDGDTDPDDSVSGLAGVANGCRDWLRRQENGGILLDLHFEGGGAPGIFAIYPDWPGDRNPTDRAWAVQIAKDIAHETGLGVRTSGVVQPGAMSELQSGVGIDGYRLGMFGLTASERADSVRLVIEHGSHDKNPDRAVIFADTAKFAERCATAALRAILALQPKGAAW